MMLSSTSNEELEELLSNESAFEMFFQQLDQVQEQKTVQEELRRGNELFASKFHEKSNGDDIHGGAA
jgi:hypothetical protein